MTSSAVKEEERSVDINADGPVKALAVPGLGNVVATNVLAGSSTTPALRFTMTGLHLTTDTPAVVLIQTRQSDNQDHGWGDEFAVQVISTSRSQILCRILRVDGSAGWGQNLRLDVFIVDAVSNP